MAVDSASQTLAGAAIWWLVEPTAGATELVLDPRDLVIERVWAAAAGTGPEAAYALGAPEATLGQALQVALPAGATAVRIVYRTSPGAAAR